MTLENMDEFKNEIGHKYHGNQNIYIKKDSKNIKAHKQHNYMKI